MIRFTPNTEPTLRVKLTSLVMLLGLASFLIHPLLHYQEMGNHSFSPHHHSQVADSEQLEDEKSSGNHSEPRNSAEDDCIHCVLAASTSVSLSSDHYLPLMKANGKHLSTSERVYQDASLDGSQLRAPPTSA